MKSRDTLENDYTIEIVATNQYEKKSLTFKVDVINQDPEIINEINVNGLQYDQIPFDITVRDRNITTLNNDDLTLQLDNASYTTEFFPESNTCIFHCLKSFPFYGEFEINFSINKKIFGKIKCNITKK